MRLPSLACVVVALHASTAVAADACSLLAQSEAAVVVGQPVTQVIPAGPERDDESGGQLSHCTYRAANAALVVSVVEFPSGAEAREQLTKNLVQERVEGDNAKVSEEPGLGDKAFYGATAKGATFVFLYKNKVIGVGVGGPGTGQRAGLKELLRTAAKTVASKA